MAVIPDGGWSEIPKQLLEDRTCLVHCSTYLIKIVILLNLNKLSQSYNGFIIIAYQNASMLDSVS